MCILTTSGGLKSEVKGVVFTSDLSDVKSVYLLYLVRLHPFYRQM